MHEAARQTAAPNSVLGEIEGVLATSSHAQRIDALRRVTDLFVRNETALTPQQSVLFDEVLGRLIEDIETVARAELARRIAPSAFAPHGLVTRLAFDPEIEVAGPVLLQSPVLKDADLLAVARQHGQAHLKAIAARPALSEAVTDVLVERGDQHVVRTVAANDGARLSRSGFRRLIDRSRDDEDLQETIGNRADLPEDIVPTLLAQATEAVVRKLSAARDFADPTRVRRATFDAADKVAAGLFGDSNLSEALTEVTALRDAGGLDEAALRAFAQQHDSARTLVALSLLCNLALPVASRLFGSESSEPILVLAKANNLGWITVRHILRLRPDCSEAVVAAALDGYTKLTRDTAKRIVRFWQVRDSAAARVA